jgi:acylphosphatase
VSEAPQSNVVRRHVIYRGRVQGVFFRATSYELSQGFRIVGHVRNMPNGTVELEAEGPEPEVERFLTAVANEFQHNITAAEVRALPVRGDERDFRIGY